MTALHARRVATVLTICLGQVACATLIGIDEPRDRPIASEDGGSVTDASESSTVSDASVPDGIATTDGPSTDAPLPSCSTSTQLKSGTTATQGGSGRAWLNAQSALVTDELAATSTFDTTTDTTTDLFVTDFPFDLIPPNATIQGIRVSIVRQGAAVKDDRVELVLAGTSIGQNRSRSDEWPPMFAPATYGGPDDLWGTTLTTADLTNKSFGALVRVKATSSDGSALVDAIQMEVFFCD